MTKLYIYNIINSNKQKDNNYHGKDVLELKTGKEKYFFIKKQDKNLAFVAKPKTKTTSEN